MASQLMDMFKRSAKLAMMHIHICLSLFELDLTSQSECCIFPLNSDLIKFKSCMIVPCVKNVMHTMLFTSDHSPKGDN